MLIKKKRTKKQMGKKHCRAKECPSKFGQMFHTKLPEYTIPPEVEVP